MIQFWHHVQCLILSYFISASNRWSDRWLIAESQSYSSPSVSSRLSQKGSKSGSINSHQMYLPAAIQLLFVLTNEGKKVIRFFSGQPCTKSILYKEAWWIWNLYSEWILISLSQKTFESPCRSTINVYFKTHNSANIKLTSMKKMHMSSTNIKVIIFQIPYIDHRVMLYFMGRGAVTFMSTRWNSDNTWGWYSSSRTYREPGRVWCSGLGGTIWVKDPSSWFASSKKDGQVTGRLCGAVITDSVYLNTRLTDVRAISSFDTDIIQINNSNMV